MPDTPSPDDARRDLPIGSGAAGHAELVRLLVSHQRDVHSYVLSLVPHWADAEEIVQETFVRIWEQLDQWDRERDFRAWACTIAYYQVLTFRKRVQRRKVQLSQAFVEAVAVELEASNEVLDQRRGALTGCLGKLDEAGQELLELVYRSGLTAQEVAQEVGYSVEVVYKRLSRIRKSLHRCIDQVIRNWQANGGSL